MKRNYQDPIFDKFIKRTEVYCPESTTYKELKFNWYNPENSQGEDTLTRRPAFIWLHGGGGDLDQGKQWAKLTKYGYPVFSLDFGESGGGFDPANILAGILNAGVFVRFLHANHKKYGVNANQIILSGTSFGGMIALSYGPAQSKFRDPRYPQFVSPVNDLYKKAKQNILVSCCFPGSMDDEFVPMIDATCAPVRAYHGVNDFTLPIFKTRKVIREFTSKGIDAVLKEYPLGHKLNDDEIIPDLLKRLAELMGIPVLPETVPA